MSRSQQTVKMAKASTLMLVKVHLLLLLMTNCSAAKREVITFRIKCASDAYDTNIANTESMCNT